MDSVIPALVVVRKYSFCCFCFCWISSIFKEISSGKILQHSENNRNLLIYLKVKYFKFGDWKKWKTHAILAAFARACVCVCVWVVCVFVSVCVYVCGSFYWSLLVCKSCLWLLFQLHLLSFFASVSEMIRVICHLYLPQNSCKSEEGLLGTPSFDSQISFSCNQKS